MAAITLFSAKRHSRRRPLFHKISAPCRFLGVPATVFNHQMYETVSYLSEMFAALSGGLLSASAISLDEGGEVRGPVVESTCRDVHRIFPVSAQCVAREWHDN